MRHQRFHLTYTTCRRCNKPLATGSHSLTGADAAKAQYDRICESCVTEDERHAMLKAQGMAIVGGKAGV